MRDLTILFVFLISIASGTPAEAAEDIQMVEQYFDALTTMEADFTQINEDSSISSGIFYLQRPGKFRLDYTDPDSLLVVTQGNDLVTYDSYSDDVTYIPLGDTLANVLLREKVRFSGDITVSSVTHTRDEMKVTIVKTRAAEEGSLTMIFRNKPQLELIKWIVVDNQGTRTQVHLSNVKKGQDLDPGLFRFKRGVSTF